MYLDYRTGKKHIKAISRATLRTNATPRSQNGRPDANANANAHNRPLLPPSNQRRSYGATLPASASHRSPNLLRRRRSHADHLDEPLRDSPAPMATDSRPESELVDAIISPAPAKSRWTSYDDSIVESFVLTPDDSDDRKPNPFELPAPAIPSQNPFSPARDSSHSGAANAYEVGTTSPPRKSGPLSLRARWGHTQLRRMFTSTGVPAQPPELKGADTNLVAFDHVRLRQNDFFEWLDGELDKVESFYKSREEEAGKRVVILREQLHEMRDRRLEELAVVARAKHAHRTENRPVTRHNRVSSMSSSTKDQKYHRRSWLGPLGRMVEATKAKALGPRAHANSNTRALQDMTGTPATEPENPVGIADHSLDYVQKHTTEVVPYRTAKRKLKLALGEAYRGMELLKSYALLNRIAFRKINKKYDKAINAYPPLRYMTNKVNKSWFVQSDVLDGHLHVLEDLYARYFEAGNHKVAVGKLRSSYGKKRNHSKSAFHNGILIGTGAVFAIQGTIYGYSSLWHPNPTIALQTRYLLQIYGGYFLALYLFCWFCLDCRLWTRHKINYKFVFEFDPRHTLEWQQLSEFASLCILFLGLFLWVNFTRYGDSEMYIYFPVILIFVTAVLIFFPAPVIYHRSREWFIYSHWRLFWAGSYPVEFRDFLLGDMYCSLTYFMNNIELFFCLYARHWQGPEQCNSTHSRLLGFFAALPPIWRIFHCLRRYYDTRNIFPHLVNCAKYCFTAGFLAMLSVYRINQTQRNLAIFIVVATINSIFSSIWDLVMDWSVLKPDGYMPRLRDIRAFKTTWWYYVAMVVDPILRFSWIFYAIYTRDVQHNTFVSFMVSFAEVTRRGMWTLFRVENEHATNVERNKASRDLPLPYSIWDHPEDEHRDSTLPEPGAEANKTPSLHDHDGGRLEAQALDGGSLKRRISPIKSIKTALANAHTQDFVRKKVPGNGYSSSVRSEARDRDREANHPERVANSSDEEDEEADAEEIATAEELVRLRTASFDFVDDEGDAEENAAAEELGGLGTRS
ncbi:hypothetical protein HYALB_00006836 [Hymenoscyphus albidus]|uniref:Uncharacterized protein n=1 Tax=Hymenoscyphus albidus TaxID=595503 RepID=A0A9N9LGI7_9HELO|nr:hypothetical protein HYALB_00006836 [Hymenoscyphus albidus]